ncbi:TonB-dependent receptor domain-containing protein [Oceanimonas baumannii]|uniref:Vitamin B12 transporter n=1 Tax=Oceanimonas baumannii TaxID=129578 RepID=A0A235CG36_9GAMM|nr:TonB-dependent receptor [Oceanimonas baumannii]OYD23522.1 vitamin B12 transporter btuB [Oceanimonas baumannii]TDW56941.1 vitamin B12 transporter [Oceanimonas baumannii]
MSKKLLATALLPWVAFAQNSTDPTNITIYNRVEQPLTSALAPVEVITKADIERRQPRSLVDLLETLPGMQFGSQYGGIGQGSSLFVRGTNSDHVLVLFNGRPLAQMVSSNVDFSKLPVSNVERIEYIRGPRAAIYGSQAIGGVVNIITTSQVNTAKVGITAGSNDYYAADVSINRWVTEATRLQLAGGYRETRGFDVIPGNSQTDRDGFDSKTLTLGIEHQLNPYWTANANFNGWENNLEYDYYEPVWITAGSDQNHTEAYQVDAGLQYKGDQLSGQLNAGYGEYEAEDWNKEQGRHTAGIINTATTRIDGLFQYHYSDHGYVLTGMDWQQDRLKAKSTAADARERDNTGVYASVFHQWAPLSLELTGRVDDNEQFDTHGTWQSALSLALPAHHKVTLSYGTAFKAPTFSNLYGYGGNTELKPEESENWELGLSGDYELVDWQVNLYRNKIDNLIVYQGGYVNSTKNTDALIKGVELIANVDTGPVHHVFSYDYTDAKDENNNGLQLARRAKNKFSWTGDIDVANANLFAQALYVGERNDSAYSNVVMPSYTVWNIGASYPLTSSLTLNGKINNLFDKDYQVVDGYDAPDMEFYVGADYRF